MSVGLVVMGRARSAGVGLLSTTLDRVERADTTTRHHTVEPVADDPGVRRSTLTSTWSWVSSDGADGAEGWCA